MAVDCRMLYQVLHVVLLKSVNTEKSKHKNISGILNYCYNKRASQKTELQAVSLLMCPDLF